MTVPLEVALGGVAGGAELRSLSCFGLSQTTLNFTDKNHVYRARQLVTERLEARPLAPDWCHAEAHSITTGSGEVLIIQSTVCRTLRTLRPRVNQLMALWEMQEYTIKPQLRAVPVSLRSTLTEVMLSRSLCSRISRSSAMRG